MAALVDAIDRLQRERVPGAGRADARREEIRRLALLQLAQRLDRQLREGAVPEGTTWQAAERLAADLLKDDER